MRDECVEFGGQKLSDIFLQEVIVLIGKLRVGPLTNQIYDPCVGVFHCEKLTANSFIKEQLAI